MCLLVDEKRGELLWLSERKKNEERVSMAQGGGVLYSNAREELSMRDKVVC